MLGHADAVGAGGVHDQNAARGRGGNVHVVDACARARDDAQTRCRRKQRRSHLRRASDDQRVRLREIARKFVGFPSRLRVDGPSRGFQEIGGRVWK